MKQVEKKVFKARQGAPFKQEEAQIIGEYVEKFETPKDILEDAKNEASPIHHLLTWDENEAAFQYRLQEVKNIVNHIEVDIVYAGGEIETFERGFEYVIDEEGDKKFVPIEKGLSEETYYRQIIQRAWANFDGWVNRYGQYKEFNKIVKAAEETKEELLQANVIS